MKPISQPFKRLKPDLSDVSRLILGGAAFSQQYTPDPDSLSAEDILMFAFENGINSFDTSPYYGPSEVILGKAVDKLIKEGKIKRDQFHIFTKAGRIALDEFDYTPSWIEKSVKRSLERFNTTYIDSVYLHDVEFQTESQVLDALKKLKLLKQSGLINNFGVSGYPVDYLYKICKLAKEDPELGPVDAVLSYCNLNLQNSTLLDWYDKFIQDTGVRLLNNGSILSMSLLSPQETRSFHPASQALRKKCAELTGKYSEIAEISTRYAFSRYLGKQGSTVIGCCNLDEIASAVEQYWKVVEKNDIDKDEKLFQECTDFLGDHFGETWQSGIH